MNCTDAVEHDADEEEVTMGEMLRTLSNEAEEDFDFEDEELLFGDAAGGALSEVDLFARVGSNEYADDDEEDGALNQAFAHDDSDPAAAAAKAREIEEGEQLFEEEAEMLEAMYDGCRWNERHDCFSVQVLRGDTLQYAIEKRGQKSSGVVINFLRLRGYPNRAPEVCVEPWHGLLSTSQVHQLYATFKDHCETMLGSPLLSSICSLATDLCDAMIRLRLDDSAAAAVQETDELKKLGLHIRGADEKLSPSLYLGSIADLIAKLPKGLDVINVENVLRPDLAQRFERMQRYFYHKYVTKMESKKETRHLRTQQHILKLADIRPAFHGTRMVNVGKIVRSGLLVPGTDTGVKVATGSRYGQGIYSSPDPALALAYSGAGYEDMTSRKLMICAVLMGKEKKIANGEEPWGGGCTEGYDSHISQDGRQYVVFHEAQILPCYVLHLMYRVRDRNHLDTTNKFLMEQRAHNAAEKRKVILTQMARKNLPFGFGPRGANFVVEEIGAVSDDEEDWGQFQELRHGGGVGFEEYQHETLRPPPPPPAAAKVKVENNLQNPNR